MLEWRYYLISVLLIVIANLQCSLAADECQKLAICALDKCIPSLPSSKGFPSEKKLIKTLIEKVNFGCVLGPSCYEQCLKCDSCKYAQEQVKRLLLREQTGGQCPKLEQCARSCLTDQVGDPFGCVFKSRCVHHCLDRDDCAPCRDIVKRVFTGFCYRNGFIEHYRKKCRRMFDELAEDLIETRQ